MSYLLSSVSVAPVCSPPITTFSLITQSYIALKCSSSVTNVKAFSMQNYYNAAFPASFLALCKKNAVTSLLNLGINSLGINALLAANIAVNKVLIKFWFYSSII